MRDVGKITCLARGQLWKFKEGNKKKGKKKTEIYKTKKKKTGILNEW